MSSPRFNHHKKSAHELREVTSVCKHCKQEFTCQIVRKRPTCCPTCRPTVSKELKRKHDANRKEKIRLGLAVASHRKPRLIRYAGYDGSHGW